jgi:hypothetical protein
LSHKALGPDRPWTKDSARVTADALDALGRTEEAKALRERYGLTEPEKPNPHEPLSGWPFTLLAKVKQQRRPLALFLKSGCALVSGNRN